MFWQVKRAMFYGTLACSDKWKTNVKWNKYQINCLYIYHRSKAFFSAAGHNLKSKQNIPRSSADVLSLYIHGYRLITRIHNFTCNVYTALFSGEGRKEEHSARSEKAGAGSLFGNILLWLPLKCWLPIKNVKSKFKVYDQSANVFPQYIHCYY